MVSYAWTYLLANTAVDYAFEIGIYGSAGDCNPCWIHHILDEQVAAAVKVPRLRRIVAIRKLQAGRGRLLDHRGVGRIIGIVMMQVGLMTTLHPATISLTETI